jgi:toxin ParE1/3/4
MKDVVFHPEAKKELDQGASYYEERRPGLGVDFLTEVEAATLQIQQSPQSFSFFPGSESRRCLVDRFPYLIIFQEEEGFIWIQAVAHGKRRPGYWKDRSMQD